MVIRISLLIKLEIKKRICGWIKSGIKWLLVLICDLLCLWIYCSGFETFCLYIKLSSLNSFSKPTIAEACTPVIQIQIHFITRDLKAPEVIRKCLSLQDDSQQEFLFQTRTKLGPNLSEGGLDPAPAWYLKGVFLKIKLQFDKLVPSTLGVTPWGTDDITHTAGEGLLGAP